MKENIKSMLVEYGGLILLLAAVGFGADELNQSARWLSAMWTRHQGQVVPVLLSTATWMVYAALAYLSILAIHRRKEADPGIENLATSVGLLGTVLSLFAMGLDGSFSMGHVFTAMNTTAWGYGILIWRQLWAMKRT